MFLDLLGPSTLDCTKEIDLKTNQVRYLSHFHLKNKYTATVAFKIKTTNPTDILVMPYIGVCQPDSVVKIKVVINNIDGFKKPPKIQVISLDASLYNEELYSSVLDLQELFSQPIGKLDSSIKLSFALDNMIKQSTFGQEKLEESVQLQEARSQLSASSPYFVKSPERLQLQISNSSINEQSLQLNKMKENVKHDQKVDEMQQKVKELSDILDRLKLEHNEVQQKLKQAQHKSMISSNKTSSNIDQQDSNFNLFHAILVGVVSLLLGYVLSK